MHEGSSITFLDTCLNQDLQDFRIGGLEDSGLVMYLFYYYLSESGFAGFKDWRIQGGKCIYSIITCLNRDLEDCRIQGSLFIHTTTDIICH